MCNTSNALYALVLSKQTSFKSETVRAVRRTGSSRQPDPRQKKPDDHMWRDCVEGRVVDDKWREPGISQLNTDEA